MRLEHARLFYDFITSNSLLNGIELGFYHGVSTTYIAGAIQDVGNGRLKTIDLINAKNLSPNIEVLLRRSGLSNLVEVFYEPRSHTWRLMKFLEEGLQESFDFCYIDSGHKWSDTGFGFCLIERLLRPGGWVVFDDLHYTFRTSWSRNKPDVLRMTEEEQTTPQVERVFELLVETSPFFNSFRRLGRFGFARKRRSIWFEEERGYNEIQIAISRAAECARQDSAFRLRLLANPEETMSSMTGRSPERYRSLRFIESGQLAPIPDRYDGSRITSFLEIPSVSLNASNSDFREATSFEENSLLSTIRSQKS